MTSIFYALDVGPGESFLLDTRHNDVRKIILVDGGEPSWRSKGQALTRAIQGAIPDVSHIDIVVCTHQDGDHAGGLPGFCEYWCDSEKTIGEFWLPGRWASSVPGILIDPFSYVEGLWESSVNAAEEISGIDGHDGQTIAEIVYEEARQKLSDVRPHSDQGHRDEGERSFNTRVDLGIYEAGRAQIIAEQIDADFAPAIQTLIGRYSDYMWAPDHFRYWRFAGEMKEMGLTRALFLSAIDTAKTIEKIAKTALLHDIGVRWFDFGEYENNGMTATGGIEKLLEPVNSVEFSRRSYDGLAFKDLMFYSLQLSRYNVESLVFMRPQSNEEPGVLFTGDSRLAFGEYKPTGNFKKPPYIGNGIHIVTAPHHGSRVNDNAYDVIDSWALKSFFVRNGGHHRSTLGVYNGKPDRICAYCRQHGQGRRLVRIGSHKGHWDFSNCSTPSCP